MNKKILSIILLVLLVAAPPVYALCTLWAGNTYTCLSTDSKPAATNGSRLYETDTLNQYIRVASAWVQVPNGATGPIGATGAVGAGVPVGGSTNQVLAKNTSTDYDTGWVAPGSGSMIYPSEGVGISTGSAWGASYPGLGTIAQHNNPLSAVGDIWIGGAAGTPARLAAGAASQVLVAMGAATNPVWASAPVFSAANLTNIPVATGVTSPFNVGAVSVTTTGDELNFIGGINSAIQTQLANRASASTPTLGGKVTLSGYYDPATQFLMVNSGGLITTATRPAITPITSGGTGLGAITNNQVWIGTGANIVATKALASCSVDASSKLLYNTTTNEFSCGTDQGGVQVYPTIGTVWSNGTSWGVSIVGVTNSVLVSGGLATMPVYATAPVFSGAYLTNLPVATGVTSPFNVGAVSVTTTGAELNFIGGINSAIQTQLFNKASASTATIGGKLTLSGYYDPATQFLMVNSAGLVTTATRADITPVTGGGTGLGVISANQIWIGSAANTVATAASVPVKVGGTGLATIGSNQIWLATSTDSVVATSIFPVSVQRGGTGMGGIALNQIWLGTGTNTVATAASLPVKAGGTGIGTIGTNQIWYASATDSVIATRAFPFDVTQGGTGLGGIALNQVWLGSGANVVATAASIPVKVGGTGLGTIGAGQFWYATSTDSVSATNAYPVSVQRGGTGLIGIGLNQVWLGTGTNIAATAASIPVKVGGTGLGTIGANQIWYAVSTDNVIATNAFPVGVTKGGTGLGTISANQVWLGTGVDSVATKALASCSVAATSKLLYDSTTNEFSCGTDQNSGAAPSFDTVGSGINTTSEMVVSTGAKLVATGSGRVQATELSSTYGAATITLDVPNAFSGFWYAQSSGVVRAASINLNTNTATEPLLVTKGGTGLGTITSNEIWVGISANNVSTKTLPSCSDSANSKLLFNNSTQEFSCGTDQSGGSGTTTFAKMNATPYMSATSSTLAVDIPGLSWSIAASQALGFSCDIIHLGVLTNGPRFNINTSPKTASPVGLTIKYERATSVTAQTISHFQSYAQNAQSAAQTSAAPIVGVVSRISGYILNGSIPSTPQIMVTSSSNGVAVIIYAGSKCIIW